VVLVGSYVLTTGSAALFPFQFGREQLAAFFYPEPVPFAWMTTLGSPLYWALLLSMIVLAPVAALIANRALTPLSAALRAPEIPTWLPIVLAAGMSAFCIYKLVMAGALTASEAWDRSICYEGRILRRVELFSLLGTRYYCFAYSSLPMLGCYLLVQGFKRKDHAALIGCGVLSTFVVWFDIATLMKAPAIIYIGTLSLTLLLCGFGWVRSFAIAAPAAIGLYIALSVLQFCVTQNASWNRIMPTEPTAPMTGDHSAVAKTTDRKLGYIVRAAMFRMAAGFPYYVQIFSAPDQRCGIDVPRVSDRACFGPIKVFHEMYPHIGYATGFQPSAVNVSAYGESGPWYVLFATLVCGLIIGVLSAFAGGGGPLATTIAVACCIYSYYATQVSLMGSLLDSYGLFWLLLPLVVMAAISVVLPHPSGRDDAKAVHRADGEGCIFHQINSRGRR